MSSTINNPTQLRGSEWGRWDLHVHTPASLVQHYGQGGVDPWEAFIADVECLPPEFRVIGINDYLFLDGYKRVKAEHHAGRMRNIALFLPVIELRLNHFGGTEAQLSRANLHVIFSDELDTEVIQAQFVNGLKCDLALTPSSESTPEWSSIVTRQSLSTLGAAVKQSLPEEHRRNAANDLEEGFNNFNVSFDSVLALLQNPIFANRYLLALGKTEWADQKWKRQSSAFKRTLINRPHFVFTAADTPAAFTKAQTQLVDLGVNAKLLDGSDAHYVSSNSGVSTRLGNCMTWINALPTFEGLRHSYYEYDTRVFVGDTPPKLTSVRTHSTHHIDRVQVRVDEGQSAAPEFANDIPLNAGFVAIVGNKGRGKSALTDILGLLGDSRRADHYSFLTRNRFRDPKNNLASRHIAKLTWLSGSVVNRSLDSDGDPAATETVQYLPQNFLETVCNEGPGSDERFTQELGQVIFAHVPEADRLGATTLAELVDARTGATQRRIAILRSELATTIAQILDLESQLDPQSRKQLENRLKDKTAELAAHEGLKPVAVSPPVERSDDVSELEQRIEQMRHDIGALEEELRKIQTDANDKARLLDRAQELQREVGNLDHQVASFFARVGPIATEIGLQLDDLVTFEVSVDAVEHLIAQLSAEKEAALGKLSVTSDGTPARRADEARSDLADLEAALDAPQREYQAYLSQTSTWEKRRLEIIGSPGTPESLEYLQHRLSELADAPVKLDELRHRRLEQSLAIHEQLLEIAARLRELYMPVQAFIADHPVVRDRLSLSFEVTIVESGLADQLFSMVNRQVNGSFAGTEEGEARLTRLIATTDFNRRGAVTEFLEQVDDDLRHDNRAGRGKRPTGIGAQVRKGATAQRVYELVFGLEYLSSEFWLESDSRPISQLSPGQRGTLLLLFYLLVDKSRRPIVLDQPEENLDNQTVHELLVPAIAEARKYRQVIAVTHNPNLAVVGDADQVIVAELAADKFCYVSGAIEDPAINGRIVEILEGTWPAFQNRRDKYTPTSVLDQRT
jgi:ABC-type lipoprotein export system ATPase subunit/TolA-binding protein